MIVNRSISNTPAATNPLTINPITAAELRRLIENKNDLRVYDVKGNPTETGHRIKPGIYLVQSGQVLRKTIVVQE